MEKNIKIACFLITYNRIDTLSTWIDFVNNQSIKASKIIIVDNSDSDLVVDFFKAHSFEVFKTYQNNGPSGAAAIGLKNLSDQEFDWIYWGDDDDPPSESNTFESLLKIASEHQNAGIIGKIGGKFFSNRGRTRVFQNSELEMVVNADYVTGGKQMIVSSKVVKSGILPDPKLFFGFEELEFCLRVKDAGFPILVDGKGMLDARNKEGNFDKNYLWKGRSIGDFSRINRQYYSVRNMLYILWSRNEYLGYSFFLIKNLIKIPFSIRYGLSYFIKYSKLTIIGIYHQWIGRYGRYIPTR